MSQIKETLLDDPDFVAYDAHNRYSRAGDYVREFVEHHRARAQKDYTDSGTVYASLTGALTAELASQLIELYLLQESYAELERLYTQAQDKQVDDLIAAGLDQ